MTSSIFMFVLSNYSFAKTNFYFNDIFETYLESCSSRFFSYSFSIMTILWKFRAKSISSSSFPSLFFIHWIITVHGVDVLQILKVEPPKKPHNHCRKGHWDFPSVSHPFKSGDKCTKQNIHHHFLHKFSNWSRLVFFFIF